MVDCGAFQGHREEADRKNREWPFAARELSAVVLSHAHFDHCGLLPLLPKHGYTGSVHATPATRDLASLVLMDSASIQAKDLEYLRKQAKRRGAALEKQPLYGENEVVESLNLFTTIGYRRSFIPADGMRATFYDAGHILGSAQTVVEVAQGTNTMRVAFTGDLGRRGMPILRDPETLPGVNYLVIESTYGNRRHDPMIEAQQKLADVIVRTANRGGKIIIPAFALERTQELIYALNQLLAAGKVPKLPVFVDSPMATNATAIYRVHQECYDAETRRDFLDKHQNPFGFDDLNYVSSIAESKSLNALKGPAIIISSSGMCEAGRVLHHLLNNVENPNNTILIVGYMAENTLGRKILERQPEITIFGEQRKLKAEVTKLNTFSAHADYEDILAHVRCLDRAQLQRVFLVHGEVDAQTHLKKLLEAAGYATTVMRPGEHYAL